MANGIQLMNHVAGLLAAKKKAAPQPQVPLKQPPQPEASGAPYSDQEQGQDQEKLKAIKAKKKMGPQQ